MHKLIKNSLITLLSLQISTIIIIWYTSIFKIIVEILTLYLSSVSYRINIFKNNNNAEYKNSRSFYI